MGRTCFRLTFQKVVCSHNSFENPVTFHYTLLFLKVMNVEEVFNEALFNIDLLISSLKNSTTRSIIKLFNILQADT